MKLFINPFNTQETVQMFPELQFCNTLHDVHTLIYSKELIPTEVYLYPFLLLGDGCWCEDIHFGGAAINTIKNVNPNVKVFVMMEGDHHAEPYEAVRYLGTELSYLGDIKNNLHQVIKNILVDKEEERWNELFSSCFRSEEDFWKETVKKIRQSRNIL